MTTTQELVKLEEAVLGSMMIEPELAVPVATSILTSTDFHIHEYAILFDVIAALQSKGGAVDMLTVSDACRHLEARQEFTEEPSDFLTVFGGTVRLLQVIEAPATAANVRDYAQRVKKASQSRQAAAISEQAAAAAAKQDLSAVAECATQLQRVVTATESNGFSFTFLKAGQFLRTVNEHREYVAEGLIPARHIMLMVARQKLGKSLCALDIADCVSSGLPVFEHFNVPKQGPVVYLDAENDPEDIGERLRQRGIHIEDTRDLIICNGRVSLTEPIIARLKSDLDRIKPRLLIIDTLREVMPVRDWNDAAQVSAAIRPLRQLARDCCTTIALAHSRKSGGEGGDEASGSNALTSSVDSWISFNRRENLHNGDIILYGSVDGRGKIRQDLTLHVNYENLRFARLAPGQQPEASPPAQTPLPNTNARVIEAFRNHGGSATREQIERDLDMDTRTVQRAIEALRQQGRIQPTSEKEGRAPVYQLLN